MEKPPTVYIHPQKELETLLKNYRIQSEQILEKCEELGNNNGIEIKTVIIEGVRRIKNNSVCSEGDI